MLRRTSGTRDTKTSSPFSSSETSPPVSSSFFSTERAEETELSFRAKSFAASKGSFLGSGANAPNRRASVLPPLGPASDIVLVGRYESPRPVRIAARSNTRCARVGSEASSARASAAGSYPRSPRLL